MSYMKTRDEKIKYICKYFNRKNDDIAFLNDDMVNQLYGIAYWGRE